jgi:hypothetical protein
VLNVQSQDWSVNLVLLDLCLVVLCLATVCVLCADACDEKENHEWWPLGCRGCISLYSLRHQHAALSTPHAYAGSAGPMHLLPSCKPCAC